MMTKMIWKMVNPNDEPLFEFISYRSFSGRYEDVPRRIPDINKAKKYVNEGIKKAIRTKNKNGEALLLAQLIKLDVEMCNENLVPKEIEKLLSISLKIKDPKILTRTYRAIGVGSKFLAMENSPRALPSRV